MYRSIFLALTTIVFSGSLVAQPAPDQPAPGAKPNANPCSDEVSASLKKLRQSSWFRMDSKMITENGPTSMQVDYILPDRMHQKITNTLTQKTSELILVGSNGWSRQGDEAWHAVPFNVVQQIKTQFEESVLTEQTDVGNYACKGRTQFEGRDVMSYKLDNEPAKGETQAQSQTFRMFYVDALTGLPVSNALLVPGHEEKPVFKTSYAFPIDMKIDPPTDVAKDAPPAQPASPPSATNK